MVEVEFNYVQNKTTVQAILNDTFDDIINKYINILHLDINHLNFLVYGRNLNLKQTLHNVINESDKQNKKIMILVNPINNFLNKENTNIKKMNDIICPQCKEPCMYEFKNYHIKLYDCKNRHIIDNIKLKEFMNSQNIDISNIKCDNCLSQNKANTLNNEFFICYECNMNLCPFCRTLHDKTHSIINYDDKNYVCNKHNEKFEKYCKDCKIDLCTSCYKAHKLHDVILNMGNLIDAKDLRKKMNILEKEINEFKKNLEENIRKMKKIIENMSIFYNINNNLLTFFEKTRKINYILTLNLKAINRIIDKEIETIKCEFDYGHNLNKMLYLYSEMFNENIEIEICGIITKMNSL